MTPRLASARNVTPARSLFLALVLAAGALGAAASLSRAEDAPTYEWGVAYYMSYDNNLEKCGKPILGMIEKGVTSPKVVCAVQADFTDEGGMHRYVFKSTGKEESRISSDDSASEDEAAAYFEWFAKTYPCQHYVFTFLDHGGRIDEMCVDDHPPPGGKKWMSGKVMGEKLRGVKAKLKGKLDLLFLQQCGRGSLENLYSFRGTADFVMSSPVPVGAPNTYYTALGKWLGESPKATGSDVAAKIAAEDQHYTIYTCLRTPKLDELPAQLDKVLGPLAKTAGLAPQPVTTKDVIHPVGEPIVDAKLYLEGVAAVNSGVAAKEVDAFFKWTREELFTFVTFHPKHGDMKDQLCGLSIFAALTPAQAVRYSDLDLYKKTQLPALWKKIATRAEKRRRDP